LPRLSRRFAQGPTSILGYAWFVVALLGLAVIRDLTMALVLWCAWEFASALAITNGITCASCSHPSTCRGYT
jgi:hypothetical protein